MAPQKSKTKFSFTKPAVYKIRVLGDISKNWSDKMGGMQINIERSSNLEPVSALVGQINDQSALSGILNTLYEYHLTILSVKMLEETQ